MSPQDAAPKGSILVADDDARILETYETILSAAGYAVTAAQDGRRAILALEKEPFDAVVSDIQMPGLDGIGLLRAVRDKDPDLQVILITGSPELPTAVEAIEHGVFRYLAKPVSAKQLLRVVEQASRLKRMAALKREALAHLGLAGMHLGDWAAMEGSFERGLKTLWMAFQPIVRWPAREVFAYEALLRTAEGTIPHPGVFLEMADRLKRLPDLSRAVRAAVGATDLAPAGSARIFVNLHAQDLADETLFSPEAPLSRIAGRVVLEITERAALEGVAGAAERIHRLKGMGFKIALDDLGAGYAGLSSFLSMEPDIVKIDISLVRGLDADPVKQRLVGSMASLCAEMGIETVIEGVETPGERDAAAALGCTLLQGFLFAKPGRPFPAAQW